MAKLISFYNGIKMPSVGLGTFLTTEGNVALAIDSALETGYRHFDTAFLYKNEAEIGKVLKKWLDSGKIKREELFIVTKLPSIGNRPEGVAKFLKKSLEALQLSYVDLYLIHSPVGLIDKGDDEGFPRDEQGNYLFDVTTDLDAVWKEMEKEVDAGRVKSIGVSNFNARQIKRIVNNCRIKPANLQIELHAYFQQRELTAFCKALDITVVAYGPIGAPGFADHVKQIHKVESEPIAPLKDPVVNKIAKKYNKSAAQVLLRHTIQRGVAVIPKSTNPDRIKENFNVFDFELSKEDIEEIDALDKRSKGRIFSFSRFGLIAHPESPFEDPY